MQDNNLLVVKFKALDIPEFKEIRNGKYIVYGQDNKYPEYLLRLYNKSPKHGAIIEGKAGFIAGKGFGFKEKGADTSVLDKVNRFGESANDILKKQALDIEIYGGCYLQLIFNKVKELAEIIHLDYHKVRSNEDNSEFYYKEYGWHDYRTQKITTLPAFNPEMPKGECILYYKEYRPGLNTYTLPKFIAGVNYIEADILVSGHTMNNANTGFTGSKMISFFNGEPESDEAKKAIEKKVTDKFSGVDGKKVLITFNNDPAKKPAVDDLGASDLTKEDFQQVDNLIQQNIFTAHQVTSPMLFGIRVSGQLGGRSELMESWELFKNTYVNAKQQNLERVWNILLPLMGVQGEVNILHTEPIGYDLIGNSSIFGMLPKRFIYEKIGLNPEDYPELEEEQKAKDEAKKAAQQGKFSDDDLALSCFSELGASREDFIIVKSKKTVFTSDEECSLSEQIAFAEVNQVESNILDLIKKDKRITPQALAEALKVPVPYVERLLAELEEKGLLHSKKEKVGDDEQIIRTPTEDAPKALKEKKPVTTEVFVKYSYEGPKDEKNRAFCAKLMELNRLYSRAEIEQISQRLGYSVWERRGGFYHNADTGVTTPFCRHRWVQQIVIKKK
jgi:DNA-binding MarR family transcriptional regulator